MCEKCKFDMVKKAQLKALKLVPLRKYGCNIAENDLLAIIGSLCKANYSLYTL